jgi:[ribosomal protein S18]-alanine N-acetyltransferase
MSGTEQISGSVAREIIISHMTEHDLLAVVELEETCGLSRWGWEAYYHEIAQGRGALMLVARATSRAESAAQPITGFIAARFTGDEVHINNVAVAQEVRRRGIGAALLGGVLREGARMGARSAILEVRAGNVAAQALYSRLGFGVVGMRKAYYTDPPEDALVMIASI